MAFALLLIHQVSETATHIMNKHLATKKVDILQCQEELIDAGLKAFAQF